MEQQQMDRLYEREIERMDETIICSISERKNMDVTWEKEPLLLLESKIHQTEGLQSLGVSGISHECDY